jgi:hypothetical protein
MIDAIGSKRSSEERGTTYASRSSQRNWVKTLSVAVIAIALLTGASLRIARLGSVPLGLAQDEAVDGYDAYSILKTGRDHHGNFMPIVMQGFNDYRMPLFQYSLVPMVWMLGLQTEVVRLGAAIWGIIDLIAITCAAGLMLGWEGAAAAAILGALMPWHLELSRYGIETTAASATVSIAMASFLMWVRDRRNSWLFLSSLSFGLSLYTYAVTKALVPLLLAMIAVLYWRELKQARMKALAALAIVFVIALPQAFKFISNTSAMQVEYSHLSIFSKDAICMGCDSRQTESAMKSIPWLLAANFASNFTPSFLFQRGDHGDHWTMIHPPHFGELLPEQAVLIALALIGLLGSVRRKVAILILAWVLFAAVPAALIKPLGVGFYQPGNVPTPWALITSKIIPTPVRPSMLLDHTDSRHGAMAMAPWILMSALGFVVLLDLTSRSVILRWIAVALLGVGILFHSVRFLSNYFEDFPTYAAPYFQYGIKEVLQTIDKKYPSDIPVVISPRINQPYIYVLFFQQYPPAAFQKGPVLQEPGIFGHVAGFGRYSFLEQTRPYVQWPHGVFVYVSVERVFGQPDVTINYPDGSVAYKIVVK